MSQWYRTGTVTISPSNVVMGVATYWATAVNRPAVGDIFTPDNIHLYEIVAIASDTQLTVDRPITEANGSGLSYAIIRNTSATVNTRVAAQVTETLALLGSRVTVSTTAPSVGQGKDGDIWIVVAA